MFWATQQPGSVFFAKKQDSSSHLYVLNELLNTFLMEYNHRIAVQTT